MEGYEPRINSAMMGKFLGKTVRLPGRVIKHQDELLRVQATDLGEVEVKLIRDTKLPDTYVEVIGTVLSDTTIKMKFISDMGDKINMEMVNGLIEASFQHPQIFHGSNYKH
ncbi:replication factor A protein 3 [Cantharellus anzutake]|uniref:replication factor A protein 3 n=1 Tax=Cantharellus anzutake TaxID=1750568 RepID=UPI001902E185|nr:replication factor A protein 3 [Cantharellus anzutake]KAF8342579.1 replication factor A protein 3 [Cantharellus anzutake]